MTDTLVRYAGGYICTKVLLYWMMNSNPRLKAIS